MTEKKEKTSTTVAEDMMHIDLNKLESAWGKGSLASKNILEMMQTQLAYKQMRLMNLDMESEESKKKMEDARIAQQFSQGFMPTSAQGMNQPRTDPAESIARLFTNTEFTRASSLSTMRRGSSPRILETPQSSVTLKCYEIHEDARWAKGLTSGINFVSAIDSE